MRGSRTDARRRRHFRVRKTLDGTADRPVFNRTVALRDTWGKIQAKGGR